MKLLEAMQTMRKTRKPITYFWRCWIGLQHSECPYL